ncbi:uncharacterized protein VTP21DRAFT_10802 [Calcarisporiella thermophila]|uniref:uncharacterized protein n=1 Tax=Calcarisporiella thermophila TaxID=911321 RepID=UPI0037442653
MKRVWCFLLTHVLVIMSTTGANFRSRSIGMVVFPGFEVLDVFGPLEYWNILPLIAPTGLSVSIISHKVGPVSSIPPIRPDAIGQSILATHSFSNPPNLDILIVPGGIGTRTMINDTVLLNFIRDTYPTLEYLVTVCTGSALVAKTGLLDGKNATSNKKSFDWVMQQGPNVKWIRRARWVEDGNILTSSGVQAGMDMTNYLIGKLYSEEIAKQVSDRMEYAPHTDPTWDPFADQTK